MAKTPERQMFTAERQRLMRRAGNGGGGQQAADTGERGAGATRQAAADNDVLGAVNGLREELRVLKNVVLQQQKDDNEEEGISKAERERMERELAEWRERIEQQRRESEQLRNELQQLMDSIEQTKREIAALRNPNASQDHIMSMTHELDAIVSATEGATENILESSERIDTLAHTIKAQEKNSHLAQMAEEISDQVVNIFESSNFQDITGQRITKVVNTLKFVEDRIQNMMEIWGRDSFLEVAPAPESEASEDSALLQGPEGAEGGAISQDDIDKLFD